MVDAVSVPLTADEEFQAGFMCNGQRATPTNPLPAVCPASEFTSSLISIPAPHTGDNDKNPQRIVPRNLFDASLGKACELSREVGTGGILRVFYARELNI